MGVIPYSELDHEQRLTMWGHYKNLGQHIADSWSDGNQKKFNQRVGQLQDLYETYIRFFTEEDIKQPKSKPLGN